MTIYAHIAQTVLLDSLCTIEISALTSQDAYGMPSPHDRENHGLLRLLFLCSKFFYSVTILREFSWRSAHFSILKSHFSEVVISFTYDLYPGCFLFLNPHITLFLRFFFGLSTASVKSSEMPLFQLRSPLLKFRIFSMSSLRDTLFDLFYARRSCIF